MRWFPFLIATAAAISISSVAAAHDTPNMEHTHAFQKTGYGTYRQGHSVNGPLGSITIWSPRPYTGYQKEPAVKFARPQPIIRAPGSPAANTGAAQNLPRGYGQDNSGKSGQ